MVHDLISALDVLLILIAGNTYEVQETDVYVAEAEEEEVYEEDEE